MHRVLSKNTVDETTDGVGIFCGKPEVTGRISWFILSAIFIIITVIFGWGSFVAEPVVRNDIIFLAFLIFITVSCICFSVFTYTYPSRLRKKLMFEGVWLSKDKIWVGDHEINMKSECSINSLIKRECNNPVHAKWKQSKGVSSFDKKKTSIAFQIMNSKYDYKDYKIKKIHISQEADDLHYAFSSMPTVLMINGILYSCDMMPFIDQFQKIAESLDLIQEDAGTYYLIITPRGGTLLDSTVAIKDVWELISSKRNRRKINHNLDILQNRKFIDKENSEFLVRLIEDYGWDIEFCSLLKE